VLEQLTRALSAAAPRGEVTVVPLYNPRRGADAQVFLREPGEPGSAQETGTAPADAGTLAAAREALAALPEVAAVRARAKELTVLFADEPLARLGRQLEEGEPVLDARDVVGDAEVLVNFCDANPTKALHVGHLRNVALGQALAGTLAAAGAQVTRQSQVSDYCRSMGEALAGYAQMSAHITPHTLGTKSDHFVGECFARFAATSGGPELPAYEEAQEPALSAEAAVRDDLAEELLGRLAAGDPEVVRRWRRLRAWALEGQGQTLAALGVKLDRMVHESDSRPLTERVLDAGLRSGAFTRVENGAVVYETGEEEYPRLLLARPDGFPTQHLRTIALWHALRGSLDGTRTVEVVGEEWHAYVRYHERLWRRLGLPAPAPAQWHPTSNVIYGMVTVEGGAVKSSTGRPPLVDELLDRLAASEELVELAARSEGRFAARTLAAVVALGFFLGRPTRKPIDLSLTEMLELRGGVGWDLARASVHAWSPAFDGPPDPAPEEGRYRQTVLRSQIHRRLLGRAVEQLDTYELARFYGHLSRRYLAASAESNRTTSCGSGPAQARVARAMRTLLAAGTQALGMPGRTPEGRPA
jgi:arginyl-tRNA synthetase